MLLTPAQAQRFEDVATDVEFANLQRALIAAEQPPLRPSQFRFFLFVMLGADPMPVPCVATVGVDDRGQVAIDDAWIFLAGQQAIKKHRGQDFDRVRLEALGWHYEALIARAVETRAPFRSLPAAA